MIVLSEKRFEGGYGMTPVKLEIGLTVYGQASHNIVDEVDIAMAIIQEKYGITEEEFKNQFAEKLI